jgi:membrane-bound lytic murein transglycosylase MltF
MILELIFAVFTLQNDDARAKMEESIARQRESIRKQLGSTGFFSAGFFDTTPFVDCPPLSTSEVDPLIASAASTHKVDPAVLRAVIRQESGYRPCAVSVKGAAGLMQLMPATAERFAVKDTFDPKQNVEGGARYLKELLDRFKGDLKLALAAYNAGPEKIDGKVPDFPETQGYVNQILKSLEEDKKK